MLKVKVQSRQMSWIARWDKAASGARTGALSAATIPPVAGRRIQNGKGKGKDWAEKGVGPDGGGGRPAAEEAPLRVGQGGRADRLGEDQEAAARAGFQSVAEEVGGGADVLVDRAEQEEE